MLIGLILIDTRRLLVEHKNPLLDEQEAGRNLFHSPLRRLTGKNTEVTNHMHLVIPAGSIHRTASACTSLG